MTPEAHLLRIAAAHGIRVEARHEGPTWDGSSIRWPLHGLRGDLLSLHWLAHEIAHWLVAPPEWRHYAMYGFGSDPHYTVNHATEHYEVRPEFGGLSSADDREEALALWLGVIIGAHCGLDVRDAIEDLDVGFDERHDAPVALNRLRARGLIVDGGQALPVLGRVVPSPLALGVA